MLVAHLALMRIRDKRYYIRHGISLYNVHVCGFGNAGNEKQARIVTESIHCTHFMCGKELFDILSDKASTQGTMSDLQIK